MKPSRLFLLSFPLALFASHWDLMIPGFFESFSFLIQPQNSNRLFQPELNWRGKNEFLKIGMHLGLESQNMPHPAKLHKDFDWESLPETLKKDLEQGFYTIANFGSQIHFQVPLSGFLSGIIRQPVEEFHLFLRQSIGIGWGQILGCDSYPFFCDSFSQNGFYTYRETAFLHRIKPIYEFGVLLRTKLQRFQKAQLKKHSDLWEWNPNQYFDQFAFFLGVQL